jgi:flagellar biosynthesis component FlhA
MAQQLFNASWHINDEFMNLNIVPFSTEQIVAILQNFKKKKFSVKDLKEALEKCTELKSKVKNGKEWYESISQNLLTTFT